MSTKNSVKSLFSVVLAVSVVTSIRPSFAADYEYPELLVTPRASERIEMEAKREAANSWTVHLPIQVSALSTLAAGLIQGSYTDLSKDRNSYSKWAGIGVGGGWLVATALLSASYRPYESAMTDLNSMAKKTPREQLLRERMAEEAMDRAAALSTRLTWFSVLTNMGASIYMTSKAESNSFGLVMDAAAIGLSIAPLVFPYRWKTVASEQREYKKKIYAPISGGIILPEPSTGKPVPGVALTFAF